MAARGRWSRGAAAMIYDATTRIPGALPAGAPASRWPAPRRSHCVALLMVASELRPRSSLLRATSCLAAGPRRERTRCVETTLRPGRGGSAFAGHPRPRWVLRHWGGRARGLCPDRAARRAARELVFIIIMVRLPRWKLWVDPSLGRVVPTDVVRSAAAKRRMILRARLARNMRWQNAATRFA